MKTLETIANKASDTGILAGRFELHDILGTGGMGIVYRARDLSRELETPNAWVAVKLLNYDMKKLPEAAAALKREAIKEQTLQHANLIQTLGCYEDSGQILKVMELVEGDSLKNIMRDYVQSPLKIKQKQTQVCQWIQQILAGLSHAHEQGLVHSDLKPSNIIRDHSGTMRVFDFGIARSIRQVSHQESEQSQFDPSSLSAFTPAYASLQMLTGQPSSASDDIYAVGCLFYECLTGVHPFKKRNAIEAQQESPEPIEGISKKIWCVIEKSLSFDAKTRYQNAQEMLEQLNTSNTKVPWWRFWNANQNFFTKR